jgi:hypothetical protein
MRRAWTNACVALLVACASSSTAHAQQALPKEQAKQQAERLYAEGAQAAKEKRWAVARDRFGGALALASHPQIAVQLGRAELMLGEHRNAAEHLSMFLWDSAGVSDGDRRLVEELLAEAKAKVGTVRVTVDAPGAEVLVDGKRVGMSPLAEPVFVDAGSREIEARFAGRAPAHERLEAAAGKTYEVKLELPQVNAVAVASPRPRVESADATRRWILVGGISAGAAGLALGSAFAIASAVKGNEAEAFQDEAKPGPVFGCTSQAGQVCSDVVSLENQQQALGTAAVWSFIAAGAIGVSTGVYAWKTRGKPDAHGDVALIPVWTGEGGGVVVMGAW